jgi:poly(hydroxyalkanoate) depolymerase family esterase
MMNAIPDEMLEATRLTKAGRLIEATASLRDGLSGWFHRLTGGGPRLAGDPEHPTLTPVPKMRFLTASYSNQAGTRPYKLFVPSLYRHGTPVPLIVMLHGCTQSPDDFAAGTRMNELAEAHTCLVAWPEQISQANPAKCWNWFNADDQRRDSGEPSLIAGITREVMRDHSVDPWRVYVSGLSAGGAAAAIMGEAYPELYAAIGVHSGLPCGAACGLASALRAMKRGGDGRLTAGAKPGRLVPAIVFHGDQDTTVNPRNADAVVDQTAHGCPLTVEVRQGQVPGGHAYSRALHLDAGGRAVIEQWVIHGAGHAWSGGSLDGSHTDPFGPDASEEMLRFFLTHPHQDRSPPPN